MNQKKTSNNIKKIMLRSYLIMTIIAVIFESIAMIYLLNNTFSYINVKHESQLSHIVQGVEKDLQNVVTQSSVLAQNEKVINILRINLKNEYYGEQMEKVYTVMKMFDSTLSHLDIVDSVSYWDVGQDTVITNDDIYHREEYTDYFFSKLYFSADDIDRLMASAGDQFFLVNAGTSKCRLYCINRIYLSSYKEPDGILFFEISMDYLNEVFAQDYDSNELFFMMTKDGSTVSTEQVTLAKKLSEEKKNQGEFTHEKHSYVYSSIESQILPFKYYYVRYFYNFYSMIWFAVGIIVLTLIGLIVVSLIMARRFSTKNVKPLQEIYELVNDDVDESSLTYDNLYAGISGLNVKLQNLETANVRDTFSMILLGQKKDKAILEEYELKLMPEIRDGYNVVCIKIMNLSEDSDHEVLMFCLNNIFRELLEQNIVESVVEVWDKTYFILKNFDNNVNEQIIKGMHFLEERLSMTICVGGSHKKESVFQMEQARWEADCMLEYAELAGVSYHPMYMDEVIDASEKLSVDRNLIKKIMNCVGSNTFDEARTLLQQLEPAGDNLNYRNVKEMRRYMLTILSIISIPYREKIALIDMEKYQNYTVKELFYTNMQMLIELGSEAESKNTANANVDKIKQYIKEHISDINMNVSTLSIEFNITPSYMSKLFKKDSGEGVLDYIHKCRIRESKNLLKQGKSVQEVAIMIGYVDARGYIRAFKRYEGITPGMYKDMNASD